jgi:mono/diheme cytochrome c family protein
VLYAIDAESMRLLWRSRPGELLPSGKYNEATVADGLAIVGTDRIQVFGLGSAGGSHLRTSPATLASGPVTAETAIVPATSAADLADGARLYAERCRACHESNQSGIPAVEILRNLKSDAVVEKLLLGSMQTQALGLTERQIGQIALYLTQPH